MLYRDEMIDVFLDLCYLINVVNLSLIRVPKLESSVILQAELAVCAKSWNLLNPNLYTPFWRII